MALAFSRSFKAGIGVVLVDRFPAQIRQPCLDIPGRDEDGHPLPRPASVLTTLGGGFLDFFDPSGNVPGISVKHHNQGLLTSVLPPPVIGKFLCESRPHELFA